MSGRDAIVDGFAAWLEALEKRHLADLRPSEVNRAVRALSDDYVHRRHRVGRDALEGRGKRAAFSLFFGPLHFLVVHDVARELDIASSALKHVVDLGCGTGAGGAAAGSALGSRASVTGIDRQGWTLEEAAFTYRHFGLRHRVRRGDVGAPSVRILPDTLVLAAYVVNEVGADGRGRLLDWLREAAGYGAAVLIVEPIARGVTPWWSEWSSSLRPLGAREHEWRFTDPLPGPLRQIDRAAGLDHQVRKARTLWMGPPASKHRAKPADRV